MREMRLSSDRVQSKRDQSADPGPATAAAVDGRFYQVARPGSIGEWVAIKARDQIYSDFLRLCAPSEHDTILDVGVSDVITDAANAVECLYPYPERITAVGLGEGGGFRAAYPSVRYRQVEADAALPFPDRAFDIAISNAVLEHVGSVEAQARLIRELWRVASRVFITVPHRYFPVEHHSGVPLAHWLDSTFRVACGLLNRPEWAQAENLILMSRRRLARLVPRTDGQAPSLGYAGLRLGPFSSNLFLYMQAR